MGDQPGADSSMLTQATAEICTKLNTALRALAHSNLPFG